MNYGIDVDCYRDLQIQNKQTEYLLTYGKKIVNIIYKYYPNHVLKVKLDVAYFDKNYFEFEDHLHKCFYVLYKKDNIVYLYRTEEKGYFVVKNKKALRVLNKLFY